MQKQSQPQTTNQSNVRDASVQIREGRHTPGPWYATRFKGANYRITQNEFGGGKKIAQIIPSPEDARLIAAAPELLAALEAMIEEFGEDEFGPSVTDAVEAARAAIAKAKGE